MIFLLYFLHGKLSSFLIGCPSVPVCNSLGFLFFFQLISELIVLSIRPEDDGGFFCSAQNPAGTARANFTVRVVESFEETGSAGTSGGLQENTDLYDPEEDDMFKVNIIL